MRLTQPGATSRMCTNPSLPGYSSSVTKAPKFCTSRTVPTTSSPSSGKGFSLTIGRPTDLSDISLGDRGFERPDGRSRSPAHACRSARQRLMTKPAPFPAMAGGHAHGHEGRARSDRKRLAWVAAAGTLVMATEIYFGLRANSLVLLADAGHYATDIGSLLLALLAAHWALKAPTPVKTYGYARAEVLMAFVQALALWAISAVFIWQAIQRLRHPPDVDGPI